MPEHPYRTVSPESNSTTDSTNRPQRSVIGLSIGKQGAVVNGALLRSWGRGVGIQCELLADAAATLSPETASTLRRLQAGAYLSAADLIEMGDRSLDAAITLVDYLLDSRPEVADDCLLVGVDDLGLWNATEERQRRQLSLCDSARLAEATGLNVVDGFVARDLAQRGRGGPLETLPLWLALADRRETGAGRTRALVVLGETAQLYYLPAGTWDLCPENLRGFDAGPAGRLLHHFTQKQSSTPQQGSSPDGQGDFSPYQEPTPTGAESPNQLTVEGRPIEPLLRVWQATDSWNRPPSWHPYGMAVESWTETADILAAQNHWDHHDLICTATHLIAEGVSRGIIDFFPKSPVVDELLLAGPLRHNGLLLRQIAARLPGVRMSLIDQLGLTDEAIAAGPAAILAMLHLDRIPAGLSVISGAESPRVLGRLTPGNAIAWQRLAETLSTNQPRRVSLRSAM